MMDTINITALVRELFSSVRDLECRIDVLMQLLSEEDRTSVLRDKLTGKVKSLSRIRHLLLLTLLNIKDDSTMVENGEPI